MTKPPHFFLFLAMAVIYDTTGDDHAPHFYVSHDMIFCVSNKLNWTQVIYLPEYMHDFA